MAFLEEWSASQVSRAPYYLIPAMAVCVLFAYWPESPEKFAGMCLLGGALVTELVRAASRGNDHPVCSFAYYAMVGAATLVLLDPVLGKFGFGAWQVVASVTRHFGAG